MTTLYHQCTQLINATVYVVQGIHAGSGVCAAILRARCTAHGAVMSLWYSNECIHADSS